MVAITIPDSQVISLEDFILHPPEYTEWVDGKIIEKKGMTFKHGLAQTRLSSSWRNYVLSSGQRGEVCTEVLCRTKKQGRRPDVAYITAALIEQDGKFTILPQSFPLIAEVASPDDSAEELLSKSKEYLESGGLEVWLLFPENGLILVNSEQLWRSFNSGEVVSTQSVLPGFSVAVNELLA